MVTGVHLEGDVRVERLDRLRGALTVRERHEEVVLAVSEEERRLQVRLVVLKCTVMVRKVCRGNSRQGASCAGAGTSSGRLHLRASVDRSAQRKLPRRRLKNVAIKADVIVDRSGLTGSLSLLDGWSLRTGKVAVSRYKSAS